jgi:hypothetical protein
VLGLFKTRRHLKKQKNIYSALFPAEHCIAIHPKPTYALVGWLDIQFTTDVWLVRLLKVNKNQVEE